MLRQAGAMAKLVNLLYLAELVSSSDRLLEILDVEAGTPSEVIKRFAGKHLVLTQKINDLNAVGIAPDFILQIHLCR